MELGLQNNFLQSLCEAIDEEELQELNLTADYEKYMIKDMSHANYVAKKLSELRSEMKKCVETAEAQKAFYISKIEKWQEKTLEPMKSQESRLLFLLEQYAKKELEGSSKKSIKLPYGTLQFKKQQDKFEYNDEILLAFLQAEYPKYIKHEPKIIKNDLKKAVKIVDNTAQIDNKIIPGINIIKAEGDSFGVK